MRPASIACCSIPTDTRWFRVGGLDYILKRKPNLTDNAKVHQAEFSSLKPGSRYTVPTRWLE